MQFENKFIRYYVPSSRDTLLLNINLSNNQCNNHLTAPFTSKSGFQFPKHYITKLGVFSPAKESWVTSYFQSWTHVYNNWKWYRRTGYFFRPNIARKVFLCKDMLMIRPTIHILPLIFTYLIICLRNKKNYHYDFENIHISV